MARFNKKACKEIAYAKGMTDGINGDHRLKSFNYFNDNKEEYLRGFKEGRLLRLLKGN